MEESPGEQQIQQNNLENYRKFVDLASEGVWAIDANRITTFVNKRMAQMLGISPEDMTGKSAKNFMFDEDLPAHEERMLVRNKGIGSSYEQKFRHSDGSEVWCKVSATALTDKEGNFKGSFALLTDIGELKQKNLLLNESRNYLYTFFNAIPESAFLIDTKGNVIIANKITSERLKISHEKLLSSNIFDLLPKEIAQKRRAMVREAITKNKPQVFEDKRAEFYLRHNVFPVTDQSEKVSGLAIIGIDITKEKLHKESLKRTNEILDAIKQAQSIYILEKDIGSAFKKLLEIIIYKTESQYGFLDEVIRDKDGKLFKRSLAVSDISWDSESRKLYQELTSRNLEFRNLKNLASYPVQNGEIVISNDPVNDKRSGGVPKGHPKVKSFMGVPIMFKDNIIGVIGLANRKLGYDTTVLDEIVTPFVNTCASIINAMQNERLQQEYFELLQEERQQLVSMFEGMDEVVYVSDFDTYELLYMNKAAAGFFGNRTGEKCYKVLQDLKEPCAFCSNKFISGPNLGKTHVWEHHNNNDGRFYKCIDRSIKWTDRKDVRFEIAIDITENRIALEKVKELQKKFQTVTEFTQDWEYWVNSVGKFNFVSNSSEYITGYKPEDFYADPGLMEKIIHPDDIPAYNEHKKRSFLKWSDGNFYGQEFESLEYRVIDKDGKIHWVGHVCRPVYDGGVYSGLRASNREITEKKYAEEKLIHFSFHDKLTGLYNRAYLDEELSRLDTARQLPISLIMADVNGLKLVNDAFGHRTGDRLLKRTAKILKRCCRNDDIVARWGGDEFVILLPKTSQSRVLEIIEKINAESCKKPKSQMLLSISMGYATKTNPRTSIKAVLKESEDNMYRRKLLESKSSHSAILDSLTRTLFEKSIETEEHSARISMQSILLGKRLGLSKEKLVDLELHARLHDIGKVAVKEEILKKKGKLKPKEWEAIKMHSEIGYRIANASPVLSSIAENILYQHEWWNGSGYPSGLKGKDIPLLSRIVAVPDAYDAMTSERPYKRKKTKQEAIEEIKKFAGIQFDPKIAEMFLEIIEKE